MRIIFMGTPQFAIPSLKALVEKAHEVVAVVTQPDRPAGRGYRPQAPPVKNWALQHGLPVLQPRRVVEEEFVIQLKQLCPELIVVAAIGQIIPRTILDLPLRGCINIHPSLLPRYRGATPISWAIIRGEEKTGVSIIYLSEELDSGDIIAQVEVPIAPFDTAGSLTEKLAEEGANLLIRTLPEIAANKIQRRPQEHAKATYAPPLKKRDTLIDWNKSSREIFNLVRGTNPRPGAYTYLGNKLLKILAVKPQESSCRDRKPGEIVEVKRHGGWVVETGQGEVEVLQVQLEGKRALSGEEFARGHRLPPGTILGRESSPT